jgi:hypothetical protein
MKKSYLFLTIFLFLISNTYGQEDWLYVFYDSTESCGYRDNTGTIVIKPGKYSMCFTDSFTHFAAVYCDEKGLIGINRSDKILFQIFSYDNGPDPISEGLFRIFEDQKIGYANTEGQIIIPPLYPCAFPFKKGKAKVSINCTKKAEGEHSTWLSQDWIYIDKTGKQVK